MAEDLKPRLIDPADSGGLPVFNDDIIQTQDNNRNTSIEAFEALRSGINNNTGKLSFNTGAATSDDWDVGLIISGCVIDKSVASPYPISEGYVYIDGEVMKFPAGTTVTAAQWVQITKGTATTAQRTFKDGLAKDATVKYEAVVNVVTTSAYGPTPTVATSVPIIALYDNFSELQTIVGGQSLLTQISSGVNSGILKNYNNPAFVDGTTQNGFTGTIKSRLKDNYTYEVIISGTIETVAFVDATQEYIIGILSGWNPGRSINTIAYLKGNTSFSDKIANIEILTGGNIYLRRPIFESGWPTLSGNTVYTFDVVATISADIDEPYEGYNTNFMVKS